MRYRTLGKTGLTVSEFGLGTATFGETNAELWSTVADVDQSGADQLIGYALDYGVNLFDTADIFSHGQAEHILGRSLKRLGVRRQDVIISGALLSSPAAHASDLNPGRSFIVEGVRESLARLQTDYIDIYHIHELPAGVALEDVLSVLNDLVAEGLIRQVGVSSWPAWRIAKARGISERRGFAAFTSVQAHYSLASRDIERELAPMALEEEIGIFSCSPLSGGLLSGKYGTAANGRDVGRRSKFELPPVDIERAWDCVAEMREIAEKHDVTVAEVALAYVLSRPFVTSTLIGARTVKQLEANLAAAELQLDEEDLHHLDAVSALPVEYPTWLDEVEAWRQPHGILKSA